MLHFVNRNQVYLGCLLVFIAIIQVLDIGTMVVKRLRCDNVTDASHQIDQFCGLITRAKQFKTSSCTKQWADKYNHACRHPGALSSYDLQKLKREMQNTLKQTTYYVADNSAIENGKPENAETSILDYNLFAVILVIVLLSVLSVTLTCIVVIIRMRSTKTYKRETIPKDGEMLLKPEQAKFNNVVDKMQPKSRKNFRNAVSEKDALGINLNARKTTNTSAQTCEPKTSNVRNSLGEEFCKEKNLDKNNRTLQIEHSEVKLTLSEKDVRSKPITCLAATFRKLPEVYKKLKQVLHDNEYICSPAVEYHCPQVSQLEDFARIEMTFVGSEKHLRVLKTESDQGQSLTPNTSEVLEKGKIDLRDPKLQAYYEIIGPGKVAIFTKTFSWLVCATCRDKHDPFTLSGVAFGSLKITSHMNQKATIKLYIVDQPNQLEDYYQLIKQEEDAQDRHYLQTRPLKLPREVTFDDCLAVRLTVMPECTPDNWKPVLDYETGQPIDNMTQEGRVHEITQCHRTKRTGLPFDMEWHIENRGHAPLFLLEFLLKLELISSHSGHRKSTYMLVQNLFDGNEIARKQQEQGLRYGIEERNRGEIAEPISALYGQQPSSAMHVQNSFQNIANRLPQPTSANQNVRGEV